ncbi:2-methylcitrate dehydratase PrpD [Sinorhizobium terangae]|uniref:MmgE/PrpD family protein n=1 Tax=Sinorhizobium terangae TaxID=110322 RepID=A0A6N7LBV4_SINTE|nr:MmgE/PrpD family protein [Sinorhizobium terangae]MBB4187295.1 2-methylcitrate dehydratase PrpD [Sinorhizobium terangae]MQX14679.1 MmgE/PrpD family protein [Sinorhizobium terangae]
MNKLSGLQFLLVASRQEPPKVDRPSPSSGNRTPDMTAFITQTLGSYIAEEALARAPSDVVAKAKLCLLDSLGCLFGGHQLPIAGMLGALRADSQRVPSPAMAAFARATLINALDFDDIYEKGHPGATVIAAALSVAEYKLCAGTEFLEAVIIGYEVSCRVGISLTHVRPRKAIHGHGTWQIFGAAAAAAKLMGLDAMRAAHAIAIAAANAPVASVMKTVYGDTPSMAKNNFGMAAQMGVNAARLAAVGYEGPLDVFEGETGFWRMAGADECRFDRLTNGLGAAYEILRVGFKPFSCCRLIQSSVQACSDVVRMAGIDPADAKHARLIVTVPPIVCAPPFSEARPRHMWAAQFSAPHAIAMAVFGVEPGPDWFVDDWLNDEIAGRFQDSIELRPHPNHGLPHGTHAASACLQLRNGQSFERHVDIAEGDASNPMRKSALESKFLRLASRVAGEGGASEVIDNVYALDEAESVRPLLRLLTG